MYIDNKFEDGFFQTSDIDLITALSLDFPIMDIKRSGNHRIRVIFFFEATDEVKGYVERYQKRQVLVEPKAYYTQLRDIRSQINNFLDKTN